MTTLDHSTCSLTGTVSSRLIVGVHLEVSHRRLNRPLEEMVLVFTAHLKAHQHPGHYVGSVYGSGWGSPGRCYQNGSGQDGSGGGGGSSSSMNGMPVFDQYDSIPMEERQELRRLIPRQLVATVLGLYTIYYEGESGFDLLPDPSH
ncbi:BnaC05g19340D [Brassica napus]|uniref:BnaC05g19340D protein n=1 Tax=Brassica napus TaxID=3708 RepID=A0A078FP82_BRANA|nr:BnaC05g19340D [Brassica napus]